MSDLGKPSLWLGEPDPLLRLALEKLGEELGECAAIAMRCAMQGLDGADPKSGKPNRLALAEELADVHALWSVVCDRMAITDDERAAMHARAFDKYGHKTEWLAMVQAHLGKGQL